MKVTVGTFNLNNLFSRFNFAGLIDEIQTDGRTGGLTFRYEFTDPNKYREIMLRKDNKMENKKK